MTTTSQQKPIPDTRYVKQGVPTGDFAAGERTKPPVPENDDFASGEHTLPVSTTAGDFASGEHTLPVVPENPALVETLPSVPVAIDHKE
jgi:hypothetical protein